MWVLGVGGGWELEAPSSALISPSVTVADQKSSASTL